MPWQEVSTMSLRIEFVRLATAPDANVSQLCRRFGIAPKTAYKWLHRYHEHGLAGLEDLSRRPHSSPKQTSDALVERILKLRTAHPAWGGRLLRHRLIQLGIEGVPAASTITEILRKHGRLDPKESERRQAWQRFEHEAPNRLWQMDFKGYFETGAGVCHPLTVLDDHSRYSLVLEACPDQKAGTVQSCLIEAFRRYGLPERMTMDNGAPWGASGAHDYTTFTVWLIRLGIRVSHSRPHHPQTQGKDERFHRTLKAEVLHNRSFRDLQHCQADFDAWQYVYNFERPHTALNMSVPGSRYQVSWRDYPEQLPPIDYGPDDMVRKVQGKGEIHFRGRTHKVGTAFKGLPVALRHTTDEGRFEVYFCHQRVAEIDLRVGG